jgi:uncharacterized protein involved in response to NO
MKVSIVAARTRLRLKRADSAVTLAVMTRATLGHTGQVLTAGPGTTALYLALTLAILARLAAGVWPGQAQLLHHVSGGAWLAAFGGFALIFGALLMRPKSVR